jgi:hypothetical protein
MSEIFRGWRRKAGCVTLAIACLLLVGWLRSLIVIDIYSTPGKESESLVSGLHGIAWWSNDFGRDIGNGVHALGGWTTISSSYWKKGSHPHDLDRIKWHWRLLGFGYGEDIRPDYMMTYRYIPYWSLVVPVTLLSAYLILWRPRRPVNSDA